VPVPIPNMLRFSSKATLDIGRSLAISMVSHAGDISFSPQNNKSYKTGYKE
jgi:hypothetical protein